MSENANKDEDLSHRLKSLRIDRDGHDRPRSRSWVALPAVLICMIAGSAVLLLPLYGRSEKAAPTAPPSAAAVQPESESTKPPEPRPSWIIAGYLVARRRSLVSAEVTATVTEVLVEEGDAVDQGQTIARLDGTLAEADLRIAESRADVAARTVEAVEAELNEAKRVLERTRNLSEQSISSKAALTKAQTQVATLTARHLEAKAKQRMSEREAERSAAVVAKHTITAPFSGAVTGCTAQIGETISPMSSGGSIRNGICTIVDNASIEIELDVPETLISRVRVGARAEAYLDAYPQDRLTAAVRAISPIANREKSTIKVRLGFERIDPRLRPNMAIKVNLQTMASENEQ